MEISIHDYENKRVIIGRVPSYLTEHGADANEIGEAIITALGLSVGSCEFMIGDDFKLVLADHSADTDRPNERGIELLVQDFKADALEALSDITD